MQQIFQQAVLCGDIVTDFVSESGEVYTFSDCHFNTFFRVPQYQMFSACQIPLRVCFECFFSSHFSRDKDQTRRDYVCVVISCVNINAAALYIHWLVVLMVIVFCTQCFLFYIGVVFISCLQFCFIFFSFLCSLFKLHQIYYL